MRRRATITVENPDIWAQNIHKFNTTKEVFNRRLEAEALNDLGVVFPQSAPFNGIYPQVERISWFEVASNIEWSKVWEVIKSEIKNLRP